MRERRSPTPAAVRKRTAIRCLQKALEQERLCLHYQPIVDARAARVERVEALLRWRPPGPPPGTDCPDEEEERALTELICAAERSPVIFRLENWVMREAFQDAAGWRAAGLTDLRLNVNLSAREFPRADLVTRVSRLLDEAELLPTAIAIEITETSRLSEIEAVAQQLERLRALGMELWLDDFGTGHSSLEWLSHLPLHGLKIAGTFVERLFSEPRCQVIVRRLVELARDLGLRTIAEGVETEAQRAFLAGCGCDLLQGFLLHAAVPAEDLPRALEPALRAAR
jgi:EAL domain-containing protein (putative c-di-GMP-specific phosphodiesterase class I)